MATKSRNIASRMACLFEGGEGRYQRTAYPVGILLPGASPKFVFGCPANNDLVIDWFKYKVGGGSWTSITFGGNTSHDFGNPSEATILESDVVSDIANLSSPTPIYIMGASHVNAPYVTAGGSNVGNGTVPDWTPTLSALDGTYTATCTATAADGGTFSVVNRKGESVGTATVGTLFNAGGVSFTITDGSTDFQVGDTFALVYPTVPWNRVLTPNINSQYPTVGYDRLDVSNSPVAETSDPTDIAVSGNSLIPGAHYKAYGPIMVVADVDDTPVYFDVPDAFGNVRDLSLADQSVGIIRDSRGGSVFNAWDGEVGISTRLRRENIPYAQLSRGGSSGGTYVTSQASDYVSYIESKIGTAEIGYGINSYATQPEDASQGDTVYGYNVAIAANIRGRVGTYANPTCQIVMATVYPCINSSLGTNVFEAPRNYAGWARQNFLTRSETPSGVPGLVAVNDDEAILGNGLGGYNLSGWPEGQAEIIGDGIHCGWEWLRQQNWDIYTVFGKTPTVGPELNTMVCDADGRVVYGRIACRSYRDPDGTFHSGLDLSESNSLAITLPAAQGGLTLVEGYVDPLTDTFYGFPNRKVLEQNYPYDNIAPTIGSGTPIEQDGIKLKVLVDGQMRVRNYSLAAAGSGGADSTAPALDDASSYVNVTGRYVVAATDETVSLPLAPTTLNSTQRDEFVVRGDGTTRTLTRARTVSDDWMLLVTDDPIGVGVTTTIQHLGASGVKDASNNLLGSFSATTVTNNSVVADIAPTSGNTQASFLMLGVG